MTQTYGDTASGDTGAGGVGQQVGQAAGAVADRAHDLSGQVAEKAQEVGGQVAGKLQEAGGRAGDQVRQQLDQRSTEAGHQLDMTSSALRKSADELRSNGGDLPARVTAELADRSERLASYLRDSDANTMLADVERFGRSQPWAVIAGGIMLGFMGSRFLKASSRRRYESSVDGSAGERPLNGRDRASDSGRDGMLQGDTTAYPGTGPSSWPPPPPVWSPTAAPERTWADAPAPTAQSSWQGADVPAEPGPWDPAQTERP
ncbi:MAG: hypothetical protein ABR564_09295 [Candidatus Dormibacteria bacterium]